jgi:C4-dicarboxylate-specific signal transduction histidine kinase
MSRVQPQQVLLNLIINAVEAMTDISKGARELLIRTGKLRRSTCSSQCGNRVLGLDPKRVDHLFAPFYTTKASGMGMGLAICRLIIEAHGGQLWACTNEPRGADFQRRPEGTVSLGSSDVLSASGTTSSSSRTLARLVRRTGLASSP